MVLSNKKLKQKLRANLADSLTASVAETSPKNNGSTNPDQYPKTQSLKELIDSAIVKPRMSKREKRRKTLSLQGPEIVNSSINAENGVEKEKDETENVSLESSDEKKRKKKRKRDQNGEGVVEQVKKKKKKKKKKHKKKKKEEKKDGEVGNGEQLIETVKISDSGGNEDFATKVYVGGIPYYSTEDDIRSYFEGCGTITQVDCMTFPESGKFRGIAIISFKTEAAAKRALAFDGADMGGLFLKIQPYKTNQAKKAPDFSPEIVKGYNRIYIGNLSWDITEDDLRKFFSDCTISSIRFGVDKETGEFRGYAHVDFSDSLSLSMALKLDQQIACGRPVKIRCAVPMKGAGESKKADGSGRGGSKMADSGGGAGSKNADGGSMGGSKEADGGVGAEIKNAEGGEMSAGSGKIRRRTCYECGEKGHLASACPKKQTVDSIKPNPS